MGYDSRKLCKGTGVETSGLRFDSQDDALNFARQGVEKSNRLFSSYELALVKRYEVGDIDIAIEVTVADRRSRDYDLIVSAIPSNGRKNVTRARRLDPPVNSFDTNWNQRNVLVGVTQLVQCPQVKIPSTVRLERHKKRPDFVRSILATTSSRSP